MGKSTLLTSIFDLRLQNSQQGVRLGKLLELIGLVSAETNDVTQSLRSIGLPLSRKAHTKSSVMGNVYWRHCEYRWRSVSELLISKKRLKWPFTSSSLSGWMSSMSLCASFSSFSHCRGTASQYNSKSLLCVRFQMNMDPLFSYCQGLKSERGRLHAADKSQQHIHHGRCIDVFQD